HARRSRSPLQPLTVLHTTPSPPYPASFFNHTAPPEISTLSLHDALPIFAAGARTQLANLVAAVFCFLTLVLLTPLFRGMPHPALAAIVIAAMLHLSKPEYLRDLFGRSRWEFILAAIVLAGELTLGVPQGIVLGVALSLLMLIYRTSHPQSAALGQLPGTEAYRDIRRHPEAITFPGLLIWRVGGDLFFASIGHLDDGLKAALAASRPPANHVLLDADSVNFADTTGCDALLSAIKELQSRGITFAFARVRDEVRERLRFAGVEAAIGPAHFYERVTDGVLAWRGQEQVDGLSAGRCWGMAKGEGVGRLADVMRGGGVFALGRGEAGPGRGPDVGV